MISRNMWGIVFVAMAFCINMRCATDAAEKRVADFNAAAGRYLKELNSAKDRFTGEALYSKSEKFGAWAEPVKNFIYEVEQAIKKSSMSPVNKNMIFYARDQFRGYSKDLFNCIPDRNDYERKVCDLPFFTAKVSKIEKTIKKLTPIEKSSVAQGILGPDDADTKAIKEALRTALGYLTDMYESVARWAPKPGAKKKK